MRVTTAFNKMLSVPGASVASVEFTPEGLWSGCAAAPAGRSARVAGRAVAITTGPDVAGVIWTWARASCCSRRRSAACTARRCDRIVTEAVPWARPRARHSRDFEDVVSWLAQRSDKTTISRLLRTSWETVAGIVTRVVAEQIDARRLTGLLRIGVDEVSYRKGHRYLIVVADHDQAGRVVWAGEGKSAATLEAFYDELGETGCAACVSQPRPRSGQCPRPARRCCVRARSRRPP